MSYSPGQTVLLIEPDASLRRLIVLGLQYHGVQVIEASSPSQLSALEEQSPDVLVVDIDGGVTSDWSLLSAVQAHPTLSKLPVVVLGWECLVPAGITQQTATSSQLTCLTKPFDARTLHTTVEHLLAAQRARAVAIAAKAEELLLATYSSHLTPSICPFITAAGLLLVVIGLMVQLTLTALGVLVVLVALLWWTLGSKPKAEQVIRA